MFSWPGLSLVLRICQRPLHVSFKTGVQLSLAFQFLNVDETIFEQVSGELKPVLWIFFVRFILSTKKACFWTVISLVSYGQRYRVHYTDWPKPNHLSTVYESPFKSNNTWYSQNSGLPYPSSGNHNKYMQRKVTFSQKYTCLAGQVCHWFFEFANALYMSALKPVYNFP